MKKLQESIIKTFYEINQGEVVSGLASTYITPDVQASLEFGIAEGLAFNFIDRETLVSTLKYISKKKMPILDFLCIARYYKVSKDLDTGKRRPLRFDYLFLRFLFNKEGGEILVFHEKGIRRVSIEDLLDFIVKKINEELSKKRLLPMTLEGLHAL